jgi:hypothetical protein
VSNKKYKALLEGNDSSTDDKLDAIMVILTDNANEALSAIGSEEQDYSAEVISGVLRKHVIEKFKELAPELVERYELYVHPKQGFMEPGWTVRISYKRKPYWGRPVVANFTDYATTHMHTGASILDGTVRYDGMRSVRDTVEQIRESVYQTGLNTIRDGATQAALRRHMNDTLGSFMERGDITGYHVESIERDIAPRGYPSEMYTVNFTVSPTQALQRIQLSVNINP